ncbi:MAG TPA: ribokinase, partial [Clostridiales bacterium]|nr:ribokinase [Clostridiales bacterium]
MNKILVVGSVNIDLVIKTERIPSLGETVSGSGFSTICGGKGANQAVAIAKSGGDVTMLACVGDDVYGKMAISNLNRAGVCPAVKVCDNAPTGVAVI